MGVYLLTSTALAEAIYICMSDVYTHTEKIVSQESAGRGTQETFGISITGGRQTSAAFSSEQLDLGLKLPSSEQGFGLETPKILSSLDYFLTAGWCGGCLCAGLTPVLSDKCALLGTQDGYLVSEAIFRCS